MINTAIAAFFAIALLLIGWAISSSVQRYAAAWRRLDGQLRLGAPASSLRISVRGEQSKPVDGNIGGLVIFPGRFKPRASALPGGLRVAA